MNWSLLLMCLMRLDITPSHWGRLGEWLLVDGNGPSTSCCFSTGVSRTFFTAAGRCLNRGGYCRHATHDGGDGDNGNEENLFSDGHWLQPHQGEADSIRHGFLCLPHPLAASTNGGRQPQRYPHTPHSTLLYI